MAADAPVIQPGKTYRLTGVGSGHALAPSDDNTGVVTRTSEDGNTEQQWSARRLTTGHSNQERYELVNDGNGRRLAVRDDTAVLEPAGSTDPAAQWSLSTTGNGTWTFVNVGTGLLLDVVSASTEDGAWVSVYRPTSGSNQLWTVTAQEGGQDDAVTLAARHSGKCASRHRRRLHQPGCPPFRQMRGRLRRLHRRRCPAAPVELPRRLQPGVAAQRRLNGPHPQRHRADGSERLGARSVARLL